jgi:branched-chain amino acid transport system substrate-binding protein
MDHFVGVWWSGSESDVVPAGKDAIGYKAGTFHGVGSGWKVHDDIVKVIYGGDRKVAMENNLGEVLYNRGLFNAVLNTEAIRTAMGKFGNRPLKGEEVRWGLENLDLTEQRLKELGLAGFTHPIKVTCEDHEGNGPVIIQQWKGDKWELISDWIDPMREVVRPMIEQAAMQYAKENNITPRDCSKEG